VDIGDSDLESAVRVRNLGLPAHQTPDGRHQLAAMSAAGRAEDPNLRIAFKRGRVPVLPF
jgi:hypothetical protein